MMNYQGHTRLFNLLTKNSTPRMKSVLATMAANGGKVCAESEEQRTELVVET
jgi:hypothetical protein